MGGLLVCIKSFRVVSFSSRSRTGCSSLWLQTTTTANSNLQRCFSGLDDLLGDVESLLLEQPDESAPIIDGDRRTPWVSIDWKSLLPKEPNNVPPSPVQEHVIRGRTVYLKRDDCQKLDSSVSGNKARKLLALNALSASKFPSCLVSYGGPQSNAMLALAAVVHFKNTQLLQRDDKRTIRFDYYTKKLPRFLKTQPSGNLFRALSLGMELKELSPVEYNNVFGGLFGGKANPPMGLVPPIPTDSLWIPQGGASPMAQPGVEVLAQEILSFWKEAGTGRPLSVCVPGGTCSTAVLLHHALKTLQLSSSDPSLDIEVVVIPCVGDMAYATRQMMSLSAQIGASSGDLPAILAPTPERPATDNGSSSEPPRRYFSFGEPDQRLLDTFEWLKEEENIVVDLMYGAPAWTILMRHWDVEVSPDVTFDPNNPIAGREIMYVHSGGQEGINSQLVRYKYKGLVDRDDIQLPGKVDIQFSKEQRASDKSTPSE